MDPDVIARVGEEYLLASDLASLTRGLKGTDSVVVLKSYAESWVRKKLLLQKALENIPADDVGITRKVEDYRESLILYEYERALIEDKLDTTIQFQELQRWYEELEEELLLDDDYYNILYARIPKDAPQLKEARKWIVNPRDEDEQAKRLGYCRDFANAFSLEQGIWFTEENLLKMFPLSNYELSQLRGNTKFHEFQRADEWWFISAIEHRKKGEKLPLELARTRLSRILLEKKKNDLLNSTYDKIYQKGIQAKTFDIYLP